MRALDVEAYVRDNHRKHMAQVGEALPRAYVDPFTAVGAGMSLPRPRSWLLRARGHP